MTKKDFEALAAVIRKVTELSDMTHSIMCGVILTTMAVSHVCADSNDKFDKDRFLRACGLQL